MFWNRPSFRLAAITVIILCLVGLQIPPTKALTYAYYTYASANFDNDPGGFTLSANCSYSTSTKSHTGYSLNASGRSAEAKATNSFSDILPPYKVTFDLNITLHSDTALPLEFAYVKFGSSSYSEVRLFRSSSGKLAVQVDSFAITETTRNLGVKSWQSVTIIYDPSSPKIEVDIDGSKFYSTTGPSAYLSDSVAVSLGVLETSTRSKGEVLVDDFALSLSPITGSDDSMYSAGENVYVTGHQFTPSQNIGVTVKYPSGQTLKSLTVSSDSSGYFRFNVSLPTSAAAGKYEVLFTDPTRGQVRSYFGVWKASKAVVQRAERFTFSGGGARGSTALSITIYRGSAQVQLLSFSASSDGSFTVETKLTPDASIDVYSATISGGATADYPSQSFSDTITFNVTAAVLNFIITTDKVAYNRTQTMSVTALAMYPDGTTIPYSSSVRINLYFGRLLVTTAPMTYSITTGKWTWSYTFGSSTGLGNYTLMVSAVDAYDNKGSSNRTVRVNPATLSITLRGLKSAYQRTEMINLSALLKYPDGTPVTSGTFTMRLRSPNAPTREAQLQYYPDTGLWAIPRDGPYIIPVDEATGLWALTVVGSDPSYNPGEASSTINITRATISILDAAVNSTYPRTGRIAFRIRALYPSGATRYVGGIMAVLIVSGGQRYEYTFSRPVGEDLWTGEVILGRDFAIGPVTLQVTASDPYLNSGRWTGSFNITLATLRISIMAQKADIQIGFDSVTMVGNITYPDGSQLMEGLVSANIVAGNARLKDLNFTYAQGVGWKGIYTPTIFDPSGLYTIDITARDAYGNGGQTSLRVSASQTLLIVTIGLAILAVTLGLVFWIRSIRSRRAPSPPPSAVGPALALGALAVYPIALR
jgi:hypothetical protein